MPSGLLDPVSCNIIKCSSINNRIIKSNRKCSTKNRFKVGPDMVNPPHSHSTRNSPRKGIAENMFVITVAAQKLICPHGSTYPIKAVTILIMKIVTPVFHTFFRWYDR